MAQPDKHSTPDPTITTPQAGDGLAAKTPTVASPGQPPRRRGRLGRGLRWVGRWMRRLVLIVLALVAVVLLVAQTNWGARTLSRTVIGLANPFDGVEIDIGDVGGNWISTLVLRDVTLTHADSVQMVHIDSVFVRHRLLSLFDGTIHLREVYFDTPHVTMRQQADATWDLLTILPADTTTVPAPAAFVFQVDQLGLKDGRFAAQFFAPGRDSLLLIEDLNTRGGLALGETPTFRLDTLWAALTLPGQTQAAHLQARTQLADGRLILTDLRLDASGSLVTARGDLRLPDDTHDGVYDVDVTLDATPLALRDLYPFLPTPDAPETAEITARVQGSGELLTIEAEARLSDGARLALNAEATPTTEGALAYRLFDSTIRGLDPSVFTGDPTMAGRLNATLDADLHGLALDSLNGSLYAEVFDSRYGEYAFDRTTLRATFTQGNADVTLQTGLRGANLSINGTIRPLDLTPAYALRGRFESLDVGRFVDEQASNLNGSFRLNGRGFDLAQAGLTATLDLDASRLNRQRLDEGTLTASLADSTLTFNTRLRFPEGLVEAEGRAALGPAIRFEIRQGRFDRLDLAALLGDTTRSAVTGTFALRGEGTDPATMTLTEARLDLVDSFYGPYQLRTAQATGTLRRGLFGLKARADLDGGTFDLDGTIRPFDDVPAFSLSRVDFAGVDVGTLMQNPLQTSNLNGTLRLSGRGFDPATMTLTEARLTLLDSQYNQQRIDSMQVAASMQAGRLTFDARLTTPEGASAFSGSGMPFAQTPAFALNKSTLDGLNLGALLDLENFDTRLYGDIDALTVQGTDPQTMTLRAAIRFDTLKTSRVNRETITRGTARIDLRDGGLYAEADLTLGQGSLRLDSLRGRLFDARPTYTAAGSIHDVDLARLSGLDTLQLRLSADFEVEGEGLDPQTMRLSKARLDARNTRYHEILVRRLESRFSLQDGLLRVDTLTVRSNVADVYAGGAVALFDTSFALTDITEATFTLRGKLLDDKPLHPFIEAETFSMAGDTLWATVASRPGALDVRAGAEVSRLVYNDIRALELYAFVSGTLGPDRSLIQGTLRTELNRFSIPTLAVRYSEFKASYENDSLAFSADLTVDNRRDAKLIGRAALGEENKHIVLETLSMRLDGDQWELDQEATITYGDEYRVNSLLLVETDQEIALDGVIDLDGRQSLGLTIYNFRIGSVADLFDFPGLGGTLNGDLFLSGPAEAPLLNGSLDLDVESQGNSVGKLDVDVNYQDLRLDLDASLAHQDSSPLELQGYLPLDLRLRAGNEGGEGPPIRLDRQKADLASEVDLRFDAERFNVGWIEPFLDPEIVNEVEGRLTAHIDIRGTLADPVLTGEATFNDGRIGLPLLGVAYSNLAAEVELADDTVYVNHIEAHSGRGSLIGHGRVDLPQLTLGAFNIDASVEDFRVIDTRPYTADVSADLNLSGTTLRPLLTGTVRLFNTDIRPNETPDVEFGPVAFTEQDVEMLERYFNIRVTAADTTTFVLYDALAMDLNVEIERDVWLRSRQNPEMNILLNGSLVLKKAPNREQQLTGTVLVVPERSYLRQFGRRFEIQNGRVTFVGPATDPLLDFQAAYAVPARNNQNEAITIVMTVEGSLQDQDGLTVALRSEPVRLDQADLISYIATGRPAAEAFQLSGGGTLSVGTDLALNQLTNLIASAAGAELGLDVVEIKQEGSRGATITAGKYVSRRLFASVSWPISFSAGTATPTAAGGDSNKEVIIEYEVFDWLLVRITSDTSTIGLSVLYQNAY